MADYKIIEGKLVVTSPVKVALVCSRFNHFIVDQLEVGCVDALCRHGVDAGDITVVLRPRAHASP